MTGTRSDPPLTTLRRSADTSTPLAPVHAALHAELLEVEPGRCVARMPVPADAGPGPPAGSISDGAGPVGAALVLADFVVGLAVTGTIGPRRRITTLRLSIQMLGEPRAGGELRGTGHLDHGDAAVGVSSATIVDGDGRPVARATGRNAVLPDGAGATAATPTPAWPPAPLRLAAVVPDDDRGDGPRVRPGPDAANAHGVVQGGVLASVAARGLTGALGARPDELAVSFLRAVPADGSRLTCPTITEHAGRRLRSGRAELRDACDRTVLTASGLVYGLQEPPR